MEGDGTRKVINRGGAGCLIPFGLIFAAMGLFAFIAFAKEFAGDLQTRSWTESPAELIKCEIVAEKGRKENPFRIDVEFRYDYEGQSYTSTQYTRKEQWSDDYEKLALKKKTFHQGDGGTTCFVNPDQPTEAIMKLQSLWGGFFLLIPLIFVVVGSGIIWAGVAMLRNKKKAKQGDVTSISAKAKKSGKAGRVVGAVFFLIFFCVGLGILFPVGIIPYKRSQAAKSWVETPCTIIWSRVQSHKGDDSTTYSVDIFYKYEFNGEQHRSNRYKFMGGSSSGSSAKHKIVKKYPARSQQICYVDPEVPERAVIKRDGVGYWFLIPLTFMLIGLFGGIAVIRSAFKRKAPPGIRSLVDSAASRSAALNAPDPSAKVFHPAKGRKASVIFLLIFAVFWNGIVSIFVVSTFRDLQSGGFGFFNLLPALFMIPFVVIGIGVFAFFLHQLLGLFNPRVEITLSPGQPRLGDTVNLSWKLSGSSNRLRSLKIILTGREIATYQRGTNTQTASEVFHAQLLFDETNALAFYQGNLEFQIPFDLMYSFDSGNNEIEWEIRVCGVIKPGPDIDDTCKLEVFPAAS